jgi:hypothetical protein
MTDTSSPPMPASTEAAKPFLKAEQRAEITRLWFEGNPGKVGLEELIAKYPDLTLSEKADEIHDKLVGLFDAAGARMMQLRELNLQPAHVRLGEGFRARFEEADDALKAARSDIALYVGGEGKKLTELLGNELDAWRFTGRAIHAAARNFRQVTDLHMSVSYAAFPRPRSTEPMR